MKDECWKKERVLASFGISFRREKRYFWDRFYRGEYRSCCFEEEGNFVVYVVLFFLEKIRM